MEGVSSEAGDFGFVRKRCWLTPLPNPMGQAPRVGTGPEAGVELDREKSTTPQNLGSFHTTHTKNDFQTEKFKRGGPFSNHFQPKFVHCKKTNKLVSAQSPKKRLREINFIDAGWVPGLEKAAGGLDPLRPLPLVVSLQLKPRLMGLWVSVGFPALWAISLVALCLG